MSNQPPASKQPPKLLGVQLHVHDTGTGVFSWRGYAGKHTVRVILSERWTACVNVGRACLVAKAKTWAALEELFLQRLLQHFKVLPEGFSSVKAQLGPETSTPVTQKTKAASQDKVETIDGGETLFEGLLSALARIEAESKDVAQDIEARTEAVAKAQRGLATMKVRAAACATVRAEILQKLKGAAAQAAIVSSGMPDVGRAYDPHLGRAVGYMPINPPELGQVLPVKFCGEKMSMQPIPGGWSAQVAPARIPLSIYPLAEGYLVMVPQRSVVVGEWKEVLDAAIEFIMVFGEHKRD